MIKNWWWYNSERGISRRERERDVSCCDLCGTNTRLENWFLTASGHACMALSPADNVARAPDLAREEDDNILCMICMI
jgi:hypothetical protein